MCLLQFFYLAKNKDINFTIMLVIFMFTYYYLVSPYKSLPLISVDLLIRFLLSLELKFERLVGLLDEEVTLSVHKYDVIMPRRNEVV